MRGLRLRALFVGMAALPACSLFVSVDDLSPGANETNEAGTDATSNDAAREGATTSDAAFDAGASTDPCTTAHTVCENFDEASGTYAAIWSPALDQATVDIATDASVSRPASLRVSPQKAGAYGALGTTLAQTPFPKGLKCSFAMQIDDYPEGTTGEFLDIEIATGDVSIDSYDLQAAGATHDTGSLDEIVSLVDGGGSDNSKDLPSQIFDGTWHQLTAIVTVSGTPTFELDVDGTLAAAQSISPPADLGAAIFTVGFSGDNTVGPVWTARFDNLVCDWIN